MSEQEVNQFKELVIGLIQRGIELGVISEARVYWTSDELLRRMRDKSPSIYDLQP